MGRFMRTLRDSPRSLERDPAAVPVTCPRRGCVPGSWRACQSPSRSCPRGPPTERGCPPERTGLGPPPPPPPPPPPHALHPKDPLVEFAGGEGRAGLLSLRVRVVDGAVVDAEAGEGVDDLLDPGPELGGLA